MGITQVLFTISRGTILFSFPSMEKRNLLTGGKERAQYLEGEETGEYLRGE